jgi:uncharacterized cupredoxin-like copper-binding protein
MIVELLATLLLSRVQVTALDFEYRLSRTTVPAGTVIVELVNFGEDEHDVRLRRLDGKRVYRIGKVAPGERGTATLRLSPGRYRLWCGVGDHALRGMRATLRVTAPRR